MSVCVCVCGQALNFCSMLICCIFFRIMCIMEAVPVLGTSMPEDAARASGSTQKGERNMFGGVVVGCSPALHSWSHQEYALCFTHHT